MQDYIKIRASTCMPNTRIKLTCKNNFFCTLSGIIFGICSGGEGGWVSHGGSAHSSGLRPSRARWHMKMFSVTPLPF